MAYDGSDFVGMDGEAVQVTAGGENRPVDTFLRQRIRGNNEYLSRGRDSVTLALRCGDELPTDGAPYYDDRPWASIDWTTPVLVPFWLEGGMRGARVSLWCAHSGVYGGGSSSKDHKLRVSILDGNLRTLATASDVVESTQDFETEGNVQITVEFAAAYSGPAQYGYLAVSSQSGLETSDATAITAANVGKSWIVSANNFGVISYPASRPTGTSDDTAYLISDDNGSKADILGIFAGSGATANDSILLDRETYITSGGTFSTRMMSFIVCRSVTIQRLYADDVIPIPRGALAAQRPETAQIAAGQLKQIEFCEKRKRLLAFGPAGYYPPEVNSDDWGGTVPTRWRSVQANASNQGLNLIDASFHIRADDPTIEIYMLLITCYHGSPGSEPGSSAWTITGTLEQTTGNDWGTKTTIATDTLSSHVLRTWGTERAIFQDGAARHLVLRQWMHTGNRLDYLAGSADWNYSPKEGLLFPEDLALIQPVILRLTPSGFAGSDLAECVRLKVTADYQTDTLGGFAVSSATPAGLGYGLETTCVGWAAYQDRS